MSKRLFYLGLGALLISVNSGCCLTNAICCWHDAWLSNYQATHFADCGCGERFWNNWYNSPPQCCDPCDDFGNFTGRKWWVPNCQGCRGGCGGGCGGCGSCGPGSCPGVSPAGRMNGPGSSMGDGTYYDDGTPNPSTVSPTPAEEVPVPNQTSRGNGQRGYQSAPSGPTRTSRYPRNMQRQYQQAPPRMSRRPTQQSPDGNSVVNANYQGGDVFFDDDQVNTASGYRVSTAGTNYRR